MEIGTLLIIWLAGLTCLTPIAFRLTGSQKVDNSTGDRIRNKACFLVVSDMIS
jgi:hypothetical protein